MRYRPVNDVGDATVEQAASPKISERDCNGLREVAAEQSCV
jgi:hypothetical protein